MKVFCETLNTNIVLGITLISFNLFIEIKAVPAPLPIVTDGDEHQKIVKPSACGEDFQGAQLASINNRLAPVIRECDDFYNYACGFDHIRYELRKLGARDTLSTVKAKNKRLLIRYFNSMALEDTENMKEKAENRKQLIDLIQFYNSCTERDEKKAIAAYTDAYKQITALPYLMDAPQNNSEEKHEKFEWEYVSAELRRYGVQVPIRIVVQANWQEADQKIIYIRRPEFDLLKKDDELFLYSTYIKYLFLNMGVKQRSSLKYANETVEFERALMGIVESNEDSVILEEPQPLKSYEAEFPEINFRKYFETLFKDLPLPANYTDTLLIVGDKNYLRELNGFLIGHDAALISKYMLVQFLAHFEYPVNSDDAIEARHNHCLQQANTFMTAELSRLFLHLLYEDRLRYLNRTEPELQSIFENVKVQFERLLNATDIFERDPGTRAMGLEKLRGMRLLLPRRQIETSPKLDIDFNDNYDLNLISLSKHRVLAELRTVLDGLNELSLNAQTSEHDFNSKYGPLDVNAYYRLKKNAIEIPTGLLRSPIYDSCMETPTIYGSFVYILGHELMHGFDYDGLNYDESGNVTDNWKAKSIIAFGTKSQCYLQPRYDRAYVKINENIADTEGLRLALSAYFDYMGGKTAVSKENLKYFFLSFAQTWCKTDDFPTPDIFGIAESSEAVASQHAQHRERVNNVVANFEEFAETFDCYENSRLNPKNKCRIW